MAPKYLGPYEIIRILRNQRYLVRKVDEGEGPRQTSTAADSMKLWIDDVSDDSPEDEERSDPETHIRGECKEQNGRV